VSIWRFILPALALSIWAWLFFTIGRSELKRYAEDACESAANREEIKSGHSVEDMIVDGKCYLRRAAPWGETPGKWREVKP